jgi:hypothetical protein
MISRIAIFLFVLPILFFAGCSQKTSYDVPETLFEEIIQSREPFGARTLANHWRAFEKLGEAYRGDSDLLRAKSLFANFLGQHLNLDKQTIKSAHYDILAEYGANLLLSTPENVVLVVYYDEIFYSAMFAREVLGIRPETKVIWAKILPVPEYQKYLKKQYGIEIPEQLPDSRDIGSKLHETAVTEICMWLTDSSRIAVLLDPNMPLTLRGQPGGVLYGLGKLFGADLPEEEILARNMKLFGEIFTFDAVADTTIAHPKLISGLVQWFVDAPLAMSRHSLAEGDTVSYAATVKMLVDRLPALWKPAYAYLQLGQNLPDEEKNELLTRVERYARLNPRDKSAKKAYDDLIKPKAETGNYERQ